MVRLLTRVVLPLAVLVVLPRLVALVVRTSLMVVLSGLRLRSRGCSGVRLCDKGLRLGVEVVLVVLGRTLLSGLILRSRGSPTTVRRGSCGLRLGVELVLPTRGCTGSCVRLVVTVVVVIVVPPALIMFLRMRRIWARMRRRSS